MHLHFDCASGASGDMILAALIDAGLDFDLLTKRLAKLDIGSYTLRHERVTRAGISGAQLFVDQPASPRSSSENHDQPHAPHRHLADMLRVLEAHDLPQTVMDRATAVFKLLARAEARVHGKQPEEVHFHEISGIDSLVDVIGACLGLHLMGIKTVSCSTIVVGSGTVKCAHGELPLPAPATMEILREQDIPFRQVESGCELLTPTGAALLAILCDRFGPCPQMQACRIGYGAGCHETPGRPNVLRVILGKTAPEQDTRDMSRAGHDRVIEMRTVIDDMTAEQIAYLLQKCLEQGALDAWAVPVTMKKSRPGTELIVLALPENSAMLQDFLFRQSTTFGMRVQEVPRIILERETLRVDVRGHQVGIKIGRLQGEVVTRQPEFEDCAAAATSLGISLGEVYGLAASAARERLL